MDGAHAIVSIIQGFLCLTAIFIGLCSRRFKTAFIWGSVFGSLWAMVDIAALIYIAANLSFLQSQVALHASGYIAVTAIIVTGLLGLFGPSIRWGLSALFRRFRKSPMPQPSES